MGEKINERIPSPGDPSNLFERLVSYISLIDRDWVNRIKPANPESIKLLRKLSGLEDIGLDFPEAYKVFLKSMGENDGGVLKSLHGDTSIEDIIDLYKEIHEEEPEALNPQYLAFVSTHFSGQISFDMNQPEEPNIVMASDGRLLYLMAENFEKLLFQYAFIQYERKYYPESLSFGGSQNMLDVALARHKTTDIFDVVDRYAQKYGFHKAWFSDDWHYIAIRDDATFFVHKSSNVSGILTGKDGKFINEFGNTLVSDIGAEFE